MGFESEYEFVPLAPITHNSIPNEMKEFISTCGMVGIMPRSNFIGSMNREPAEVIDLKYTNEDMYNNVEMEEYEDDIEKYVEENRSALVKTINENVPSSKMDSDDEETYTRVNKIMKSMEENNEGVFKFLEVNGMSYDKAKKFIKRIIRLALRYSE